MVQSKSLREGTATRAAGRRTARKIVEAAEELLMTGDFTQFSMRHVAARAGVHLANLQYYFPTRDHLLHALFDHVGTRYAQAIEERLAASGDAPMEQLLAAVDFHLEDIRDIRTRRFFIQLWALLGSLDAYSGRLLRELYQIDIDQLSDLIKLIDTSAPHEAIERRATLLAAMIEGLMLMIGPDDSDADTLTKIMVDARQQAMRIARGD